MNLINSYQKKRHPNDTWSGGASLLVVLVFFFGASLLQIFNWKTGMSSAPSYQKLFPQFYFSFALLILINKRHLVQSREEARLLIIFFILMAFMFFMGNTSGFGNLFNCLILPVFISIILNGMPLSVWHKTRSIIFAFFVINCGLAIMERILLFNVFAFTGGEGDGEVVDNIFRSTALQNHPLNNALFTSIIMSFILADKFLPNKKKYTLLFVGLISLLCYNTRSSVILWAGILGIHLMLVLFSRKKRFRMIKPWLIMSFIIIGVGFYYLLFIYGWGNRLIQLDFSEDSSTYQRLKLLKLVESMNFSDYLIGVSSKESNRIFMRFDLEHVENYWIIYIMRYGLIFTGLLFFFYSSLFKRLFAGYTRKDALFISFVFLLLSSTNNSLAFNSLSLSVLIICCYGFSPKLFYKKHE